MPAPLTDDQRNELSGLIFARRKIEAIKRCRKLTGLGLKEAKDEVEALELTLRRSSPEKFAADAKGGGCLGAAVLVGLVLLAGGGWIIFG